MSSLPDEPTPFPPFGVHRREHVYQSPWCGLRRDEVILPSGRLQEYHVFEIGPAAVVVPECTDGRLVFVGQYRYPHGNTQWELPAGRLVEGEDPAQGALRELLEETGYRAAHVEALPGFYPTGGISAHYAYPFVATGCELVQATAHEDSEQIIVRLFTRGEVESLLDAGRFADAFTALPLLYWLRRNAG